MELDRIQSQPSHVAIADSIRRWIALGSVVPGDRLPSERELAERLGVGRMTVRQAIRVLADEGLVSTQRGRSGGTFVSDDPEHAFPVEEMTEKMLSAIRENYEFRLNVEPLAARLAAERANDTERWAIRGLAEGEATGVRSFRALDSRFHLAIANASHNRLLAEAVSRSRTELFGWADRGWEGADWGDVSEYDRDFAGRHRPVAEAIVAANPDAAAKRMAEHLVEGQEQFIAMINRNAMGSAPPAR
jgi:GntR family transcriptional repressor for pyruvate dehydrogenase complex